MTLSADREAESALAADSGPEPRSVGTVAVVAHQKKSLGGGLDQLRTLITEHGVDELLWYEVPKSRKAPKKARTALKEGADLVIVWGGDGMVQRCMDALAGSGVPVGIIPAGTANLLASNLGIPKEDLPEAVRVALHGRRRTIDLGVLNGERFAVMAGIGFDAAMIRAADRGLKDRFGRLAYFWTGLRHVGEGSVPMKVKLDGVAWFKGDASCLLLGNVGRITGGIKAFDDARPDDGWLDVGVATAQGAFQWARTLGQMSTGRSDHSPFVRITRAKRISVKLGSAVPYELDGGTRDTTRRVKAHVEPGAIMICVP